MCGLASENLNAIGLQQQFVFMYLFEKKKFLCSMLVITMIYSGYESSNERWSPVQSIEKVSSSNRFFFLKKNRKIITLSDSLLFTKQYF